MARSFVIARVETEQIDALIEQHQPRVLVRRAGLGQLLVRERMRFNAREAIARHQALGATAVGTSQSVTT